MMKLKLVAAGAALCALGMTGCSNETDEAGAQKGKQTVMTMQSATDVPQTRADYTEDGTDNTKMNFSWRSGDKMSVVVDGTTNTNCGLTTTTDGKSAPFSGTVTTWTGTKDIYAFYPYNQAGYTVTGGDNSAIATAALALPNPQLYTVGGAISNSFMVGVGTATASGDAITASASLKQVMSIIKLNITGAPAKVTGVKLTCTDAIFATTATVKLSDATITNPGGLVNELSMTVTDNSTDHTAAKAVSFAIFPKAKVDGKKIQIEVTYEGEKSKMIEKDDIAFERNMHYVMEFDGTPAAPDYIEVNGIKVAVGNLVANGPNNCKIGAPTDGGLFFLFGSLVGWSTTISPTVAVSPVGCTVTSWNDSSWTGNPTTDDAVSGKGDPCRYYLKGTWRLPTNDEYAKLFNNVIDGKYANSGGWSWNDTYKYATNSTKNLTFPASGYRNGSGGGLNSVGTNGFYWSATPSDASNGYSLAFNSSGVSPSSSGSQADGLPVRCVQNAL